MTKRVNQFDVILIVLPLSITKNSTDHNIWWYEPCIIEIFEKKRRNMSKKAEKRIREGEKMFYGRELTYDRIP